EHDVEADMEEINFHYFQQENEDRNTLIVAQSDYNRFATLYDQDSVKLTDNEVVVVPSHTNLMGEDHEALLKEPVALDDGTKVQPTKLIESTVFSEVNAFYIV